MSHEHPFPGSIPVVTTSLTVTWCGECGAVDVHAMAISQDYDEPELLEHFAVTFGPFESIDAVLSDVLPRLALVLRSRAVPGYGQLGD